MISTLTQRTYRGEVSRPTTEIEYFSEQGLIIAATPWGTKAALKDLTTIMKDYFSTSLIDGEATSPIAKLPGLSHTGNTLRIAALLSNDSIFQKHNKETYSTACEALIMTIQKDELTWVQIGQPQLVLLRGSQMIPLSVSVDLSLDFDIPAPLPSKLLGVEKSLEIETHSVAIKKGDRLLMVARSSLPKDVFSQDVSILSSKEALTKFYDTLVRADVKAPFWVGLFEI